MQLCDWFLLKIQIELSETLKNVYVKKFISTKAYTFVALYLTGNYPGV